jgi:hypothetical protein
MKTKEELSYDAGYYRACKAEGCHAPLKYLKSDEFMKVSADQILPEHFEQGFNAGLKACIKHQNRRIKI